MNNPKASLELITGSPEETQTLGRSLGGLCRSGDWLGLAGELGAGKTCLVQGLALGLGVDSRLPVSSPTFIILQTYPGRVPLRHLDLYRLASPEELRELGYDELCEGDGVCVVEWCDRIPESNPGRGLHLVLLILDERRRRIAIEAQDRRGQEMLAELQKTCMLAGGVSP